MHETHTRSPFFADVALAARIEQAECRLLTDGTNEIRHRRTDANVMIRALAGGVATYTGPGSPLNKLAGLGFCGSINEAELDEVERAYSTRGSPIQVELSNLADPSLASFLTRRGYVLTGFENVLGLRLSAHEPRQPGEGTLA